MKFVKMFLALVGLAVLFVFVRDNPGKVEVVFWKYKTPEIELFLILIITFVLGMIVASFGSTLKILQLKRQLKNAGTAAPERVKESRKAKKSKSGQEVKAAASQASSDTPGGTSGTVAVGTGAAAGTYTSDSVHSEKGSAGSASAHEPGQNTDVEDPKAASSTQESSASRESAASEESETKTSDEVISLPADAPTTDEEDKK
ncbi:MAG: LapA family protein [Desulfuromonadaceae bacterium]